jgi:outer membrane protein assembly factor BamD
MKTSLAPVALFLTVWAAGCSSISMPSLPWSSSAVKPDPTAEALFEEGKRYFKEKRYARAIDSLTRLKTDHPFSPQLTEAELRIADSYYLNQQYPEAVSAFKEFQSMHPTNENIPFVVYRLGQAHFDQFTSADRDQKNTEIAKSYFENVVSTYSKSPYAKEAKEKLVRCVEYLAEHDFNVASFYLRQEKYPAARERFEEIVRKYQGTPAAAKSLFFLGESYRREKNNIKAGLAYEALIQHYPQSKFTPEAKTQLAQLEKEKQDPLAMLLMRDRRPSLAGASEDNQETASTARLKGVDNLIAKTDVVYEEPGEEKGLFRRVVDKINPFSSSDDGKKNGKPESTPDDLLAKKNTAEKDDSPGVLTALWSGISPFGGKNSKDQKTDKAANGGLVSRIDGSLREKGIDAKSETAALKPPAAALSQVAEAAPAPQTADVGKLLGDIDTSLKKGGKNIADLPPTPEAAEVFKDPAAAQAMVAKAQPKAAPQESAIKGGLLDSIDQKLKSQGVEPSRPETPLPSNKAQETSKKEPSKKVELEPKVAVEKGPLFLAPAEIFAPDKATSNQEPASPEKKPEAGETQQGPDEREFPEGLVKGPAQPQSPTAATKTAEQKKPAPGQEEDPKGVFQQIRDDLENVSKILNPFRW